MYVIIYFSPRLMDLSGVWELAHPQCPPCPISPCTFPNDTISVICEMLDNSECKCFAFDSNDGIHWSAVGSGIIIVLLLLYIYYQHKKAKKSQKNAGALAMLPLQEVLPQPSKS